LNTCKYWKFFGLPRYSNNLQISVNLYLCEHIKFSICSTTFPRTGKKLRGEIVKEILSGTLFLQVCESYLVIIIS